MVGGGVLNSLSCRQQMSFLRLIIGDAREKLLEMEEGSIHAIICSPPYPSMRSYEVPPVVWGGDSECRHVWGEAIPHPARDDRSPETRRSQNAQCGNTIKWGLISPKDAGKFCQKCGAWLGTLGGEPDPWMYVAHLVEVFGACRRVLRDDGQLWVNLGDGWCGTGYGKGTGHFKGKGIDGVQKQKVAVPEGMKPKDLMGVPWLFAMAMRDDGWWWRQWAPWIKKSSLPDSANDRPGSSLEVWLQFSKSKQYFYDTDAVRKEALPSSLARIRQRTFSQQTGGKKDYGKTGVNKSRSARKTLENFAKNPGRRRRNTDWWFESLDLLIEQKTAELKALKVAKEKGIMIGDDGSLLGINIVPGSSALEHYASYPPELCAPIVKLATSEHGCCPDCGAPWVREFEKKEDIPDEVKDWRASCGADKSGSYRGQAVKDYESAGAQNASDVKRRVLQGMGSRIQVGWVPSCDCNTGNSGSQTIPCTILDPFCGIGSTLVAAKRLGRNGIGIDVGKKYVDMADKRLKDEFGSIISVEIVE